MAQSAHFELRPPEALGSPQTKLVYLYLAAAGEATVTDLHEDLGLPKTTLLPILSSLDDHDVLDRTDDGYAVTNA